MRRRGLDGETSGKPETVSTEILTSEAAKKMFLQSFCLALSLCGTEVNCSSTSFNHWVIVRTFYFLRSVDLLLRALLRGVTTSI